MYNKIVLSIIAVSLSILAIKNLDVIGSANAVIDVEDAFKPTGMLGEVKIFAGNYAPEGWMFCDGSELDIDDYRKLYDVIGEVYGGNSEEETFNLPDLRSRSVVGVGEGKRIRSTSLGTGKIFKVEELTPFGKGKNGGTTKLTLKNVKTPANVRSAKNEKTYTGELGMNYIICVDGRMP